jgi:hypothetical protein
MFNIYFKDSEAPRAATGSTSSSPDGLNRALLELDWFNQSSLPSGGEFVAILSFLKRAATGFDQFISRDRAGADVNDPRQSLVVSVVRGISFVKPRTPAPLFAI